MSSGMQKGLWAICAFAEAAAIGAVIPLRLPELIAVMLLAIPIFLAILVWVQPSWSDSANKRRSQVFVYVPPEQREHPEQAYRPYEPGPVLEEEQEMWRW